MLATFAGLAALCLVHTDAAYAVQAKDGSAHYAVIETTNPATHLQFNDSGCTEVTPYCYESGTGHGYGWLRNTGVAYEVTIIGTCDSSSTLCNIKDSAGYCWTATKVANGIWTSIENITDATLASENACANLPGPTSGDRASTTDSLLNTLVDLAGTIFGGDGIVTDGADAGTGALPFQFKADAAAGQPTTDDGNDLARLLPFGDPLGIASARTGFSFKADLGRMAERMAGADATAHASAPVATDDYVSPGDLDGGAPRDFIPWVTGRYVNFKDGSATDRDGHLWSVTSGGTFRLNPAAAIGAFGRYRQGTISSTALDSKLDSTFYGGGVFAQLGAADDLRVKLAGLYEFGKNDIVTAGDSGSFDSRQWQVEGRIEKRFSNAAGGWLTPMVDLHYAELTRDGYTDSGSNVVAASTQKLGKLSYGFDLGVAKRGPGGTGRLFASINGIWNFARTDDATLTSGTTVSTAPNNAALGLGFAFVALNGMSFHARGDVQTEVDTRLFTKFDLSDRLTSWSVTGGVGLPMSAFFGSRAGGSFNFDVATSPSASSGIAKLVVPLN